MLYINRKYNHNQIIVKVRLYLYTFKGNKSNEKNMIIPKNATYFN